MARRCDDLVPIPNPRSPGGHETARIRSWPVGRAPEFTSAETSSPLPLQSVISWVTSSANLGVLAVHLRTEFVSGHPKPASEGRLKTGQWGRGFASRTLGVFPPGGDDRSRGGSWRAPGCPAAYADGWHYSVSVRYRNKPRSGRWRRAG